MKQQYTVFSSHVVPLPTNVSLADGREVSAPIEHRVVQLVPVDSHDQAGTVKLVLPSNKEYDDLFVEGDVIDVTFSKAKA